MHIQSQRPHRGCQANHHQHRGWCRGRGYDCCLGVARRWILAGGIGIGSIQLPRCEGRFSIQKLLLRNHFNMPIVTFWLAYVIAFDSHDVLSECRLLLDGMYCLLLRLNNHTHILPSRCNYLHEATKQHVTALAKTWCSLLECRMQNAQFFVSDLYRNNITFLQTYQTCRDARVVNG